MKINNPYYQKIKLNSSIKSHKGQIIVFIEKIFSYTDEKNAITHYLLMDFPFDVDFKRRFFEQIEFPLVEHKSMLEIKKVSFAKSGKPREGRFYLMPTELVNGELWRNTSDNEEEGGDFIALTSNNNVSNVKFTTALIPSQFIQDIRTVPPSIWEKEVLDELSKLSPKKVLVDVYDVGQGNWNEILFDNQFLIVYDFGSSSGQNLVNRLQANTICQTRNLRIDTILGTSSNYRKILIISHWDIDHYNGLLSLPDDVLQSFDFCIVPNKIENETTYRAVEKLINNMIVFPIAMSTKGRGRGATSVLTPICNLNFFKIYKGTNCSDRNKRGLSLSLHFKNTDFVFPADHHYNQINNHILGHCVLSHFNLVIPHHGGNAGNYNLVSTWPNNNQSVISAGGRYGHPFPHIDAVINACFTNNHRTDYHQHYPQNNLTAIV